MKTFSYLYFLRPFALVGAMALCFEASAYIIDGHKAERVIQDETYYTLIDGIYYELNENQLTAAVEPKAYHHYMYKWRINEYSTGGRCGCFFDTESGEYSGILNIPSTVEYEGKTYTVNKIDCYAFSDCPELTQLVIPATVTEIENLLTIKEFDEEYYWDMTPCPPNNLWKITVASGNPVYDSRDKCNAIIETATNKLIFGCNHSKIPEGVRSIGREAFCAYSKLTSIKIPSSVEVIGTLVNGPDEHTEGWDPTFDEATYWMDYAYGTFSHSSLKSISLPNTLRVLGWNSLISSDLETVYAGPIPPCNLDAIDHYSGVTVYIPKGCTWAYEHQNLPEPYNGWWYTQTDCYFWKGLNFVELEVATTDVSELTNGIYATDITGWWGKGVQLPIVMKTNYDVKSFQFDVTLPEGIDLQFDEATEEYVVEKTSRVPKSYDIEASKPGTATTNTMRIMVYLGGLNGKIADQDGVALNLPLVISESIDLIGEQPIKVSNVKITNTSGETQLYNDVITSKIYVPTYEKGDPDGNHDINVGDVTAMVEAIYGQPADNFDCRAADMDGNGNVDVNDIVCVIDVIYERTSTSSSAPLRDNEGTMLNIGECEALIGEEVLLPIVLQGSAPDVRGYQFDITLPQGFAVIESTMSEALASGYKLYDAEVGAQCHRLLSYTKGDNNLPTDQAIAYLRLRLNEQLTPGQYTVTLSNITLGNGQQGYVPESISAIVTVTDPSGIRTLRADDAEATPRYDLMGRRIAAGNDPRFIVGQGVKSVNR